jgi:hypothetical protein
VSSSLVEGLAVATCVGNAPIILDTQLGQIKNIIFHRRMIEVKSSMNSLGVLRLGYFIFNEYFVNLHITKRTKSWRKSKQVNLRVNQSFRKH